MKVKIFSGESTDKIEEEINNFFDEKNVEILFVKQTESTHDSAYQIDRNYTISVFYKIKEG